MWHELRTIGFWVIGLLNTALARPERVGTWRYGVGWLLLAVAVADSVALYHKELSHPPAAGSGSPWSGAAARGPERGDRLDPDPPPREGGQAAPRPS